MQQGTRLNQADWHRNVCMTGNGDRCDAFRNLKAKARICRICDNETYAHNLANDTTVPICKDCRNAA